MCGIAGLIDQEKKIELKKYLNQMNRAVAHRGPDDEGIYCWENVGLGHRRLSILDLSASGHQPMTTQDGSLVLVFNGAIYNYLELRLELETSGHRFLSKTDTEVVLKGYEQWGQKCVTRFNGMWAFAILDRKQNLLFCSRDRFGVKPFYFLESKKIFAFGSEIRQLLPFLSQIRSNKEVVLDFLLTGICDHNEHTFFENVRRLMPGHNLIFDLNKNNKNIYPYYCIPKNPNPKRLQLVEIAEMVKSALDDSTKLRLRSDVSVGSCLSGGLDSSSISVLAADRFKSLGTPFRVVTAASESPHNDESDFATQVVQAGNMEWIRIKPSYKDFVDSLPAVVRAQEEPFGGASILMQYLVMQTAKRNSITVLLNGQGGDEIFLGYPKYNGSHMLRNWKTKSPYFFLKEILLTKKNQTKCSNLCLAWYLLCCNSSTWRHRVLKWRSGYFAQSPPKPAHLEMYEKCSSDIFQLQSLEIQRTSLPVLLRYEDKNSMAHSVEARLPFLDFRLVELALSLPAELKIRNGWPKWILRKAMEKHLPKTIAWRKEKIGFEAPENLWLKKHDQEMRDQIGKAPLLISLINQKKLQRRWLDLEMRARWRLYSVALWQSEFCIQE